MLSTFPQTLSREEFDAYVHGVEMKYGAPSVIEGDLRDDGSWQWLACRKGQTAQCAEAPSLTMRGTTLELNDDGAWERHVRLQTAMEDTIRLSGGPK
jgi:hypothetical protein